MVWKVDRGEGKMKQVLLTIMFCLLMSNIANAECAWVLWKMKRITTYGANTAPITEWSRVVVVPDFKECRMNQLGAFRAELNLSKMDILGSVESSEGVEGGPSKISVHFKGTSEDIEFQCLPDTIDPRK